MTIDQFKQFAKDNGVKAAAIKIREWVLAGQPDEFCDGYTVRALCREISNAVTGENADSCANSKYGAEIYGYAWFGIEFSEE